MFKLMVKLRDVKNALKIWAYELKKSNQVLWQEISNNLAFIQRELEVDQADNLIMEEKTLKERLLRLHADEDSALKQKSRDMRISLGGLKFQIFL